MEPEPIKMDLKDQLEMSDSCFDMIKEMLVGLGIKMDACPPMFYPEAIKNLYVWTAFASRDCQIAHGWHGEDKPASAKCIHEGIVKYGKEKAEKDRGKKE
jgi:hypothetical protein